MSSYQGGQSGLPRKVLVEEKFFEIRGREAESLIRDAVAHATGVELSELAPGMWSGRKATKSRWVELEVTARTLPTDDGTSVQVQVEHKVNGTGLALWITALVFLSVLLIPLFWYIARAQRQEDINNQERLVTMHRVWREITDAIGAPRRANYREAPKRVYVPEHATSAPVQETSEREADLEAQRLAEAQAVEEAEAAARN